MKHFTLRLVAAALFLQTAVCMVSAQRVTTNTVSPKDLAVYDGQTIDLSVYRYIHKGWNTICLPVSLTTRELNKIFGSDCRLETLVGVENTGTSTKLNFKDVKPDGLKANTPYILYSTQESGVREISKDGVEIALEPVEKSFSDNTGTEVTFGGTTKPGDTDGMYAILVKDNAEAKFVDVSNARNGILASRCFIKINGGETSNTITSNHFDYNMTGVDSVAGEMDGNELTDVYNVSGVKVASGVKVSEISKLGKGVYVVKGRTILVK